ncbi:unnamed protein product, partial [marine sediment metagenome]
FPGEGKGGVNLLAINHALPQDPQALDTQGLQFLTAEACPVPKGSLREA